MAILSNDTDSHVFERLYNKAKTAADLPWFSAEPPAVLVEALGARERPGTALDVGCGAGTYSLYMARQGYRVTAVDFMPQAIEMLTRQAAAARLDITAVHADVTKWVAPQAFDVVLDVGCLHSLDQRHHALYKAQLLRWLAPGGDFVLVHCGRRGWWDWWPIGPNRIATGQVTAMLGPELSLRAYR
ncbi:MAG: class I SAM-dependent methyltransferase, partial [Gammaproteobacteria bacterium]